MINVYYDGKCGLCAKEINHYRNIAPANVFLWQDITVSDQALVEAGYTLEQGLRRLHAQDGNGKFHRGVDAFVLIWKQLPRWKLLGYLLTIPGIRHVANFSYNRFADWRFKRLPHCRLAAK